MNPDGLFPRPRPDNSCQPYPGGAPVGVVAHRAKFAAVCREALGTVKPDSARVRAAQALADRRAIRVPGETGADVIASAAHVAARQACNLLRHGDTLAAVDYAGAELLLRERADRARRINRDRVFNDAMKGWAA